MAATNDECNAPTESGQRHQSTTEPGQAKPGHGELRAAAGLAISESAGVDDARFVARLALEADMGELSDRGTTFIARRTAGSPSPGGALASGAHPTSERLGFIRIVKADGHAYINPIVTSPSARGLGVGEALVRFAQSRFGPLRLVARGSAVPFYERIGGQPLPWPDIAPLIASDCDGCTLRGDCRPTPMAIPAHPAPTPEHDAQATARNENEAGGEPDASVGSTAR